MYRLTIWATLALILLSGCATVGDNATLARIAASDQQDRLENNPRFAVNDAKRYRDVVELIAKDSLKTSADFYHAALVLQHGNTAEDYRQANQLAKKAFELNAKNKAATALIAQSWDRYLRATNLPQWYGTQRFLFKNKEYLEPIDTASVTDEERIRFGVPTISNQLDWFNRLYQKTETSITAYVIQDSVKAALLAEEPVEIVGGIESLFARIQYPAAARQNNISGKVLVEFTIDHNGQVKNAQVVEGLGHGCDEEALRVIQSASFKNNAGEDHDMRIRVPFQLPKN